MGDVRYNRQRGPPVCLVARALVVVDDVHSDEMGETGFTPLGSGKAEPDPTVGRGGLRPASGPNIGPSMSLLQASCSRLCVSLVRPSRIVGRANPQLV
jgi:hypothetical protein